jgi:hypothetical protein
MRSKRVLDMRCLMRLLWLLLLCLLLMLLLLRLLMVKGLTPVSHHFQGSGASSLSGKRRLDKNCGMGSTLSLFTRNTSDHRYPKSRKRITDLLKMRYIANSEQWSRGQPTTAFSSTSS